MAAASAQRPGHGLGPDFAQLYPYHGLTAADPIIVAAPAQPYPYTAGQKIKKSSGKKTREIK